MERIAGIGPKNDDYMIKWILVFIGILKVSFVLKCEAKRILKERGDEKGREKVVTEETSLSSRVERGHVAAKAGWSFNCKSDKKNEK